MRWQWHQLDHIQIICTLLQTGNHANTQGCSLGLDVSVSRRSRDLVSKRLGLVEMWEGLGLDLVSDWKSNVSASSRSRTIGCRLQAKMHRFLLHCKIAPISFWMQCVYIVCWFTSLLIYCNASASRCHMVPRPWPCARWKPSSPTEKGLSPPVFGPCLLWRNGWKVEGLKKRLSLGLARSLSLLVAKIRRLGLMELQEGLGLISDQKPNVSVL